MRMSGIRIAAAAPLAIITFLFFHVPGSSSCSASPELFPEKTSKRTLSASRALECEKNSDDVCTSWVEATFGEFGGAEASSCGCLASGWGEVLGVSSVNTSVDFSCLAKTGSERAGQSSGGFSSAGEKTILLSAGRSAGLEVSPGAAFTAGLLEIPDKGAGEVPFSKPTNSFCGLAMTGACESERQTRDRSAKDVRISSRFSGSPCALGRGGWLLPKTESHSSEPPGAGAGEASLSHSLKFSGSVSGTAGTTSSEDAIGRPLLFRR